MPSVATDRMSGGLPAAIWVRILVKESFQSVPLIPVNFTVTPGLAFMNGAATFAAPSAAFWSPKMDTFSVLDAELVDDDDPFEPQAARPAVPRIAAPPSRIERRGTGVENAEFMINPCIIWTDIRI